MTRNIIASLLAFVSFTAAADVPARLSQTGLYADIGAKATAPGVMYFAPQYPLWTDGATKHRWIALPAGARIDTTDLDRWVFPVGTRFYKEFSFRNTAGALHRIETRYMEKLADGTWTFATYRWNDDESDATLVGDDGEKNVYPSGPTTMHDIPSARDCKFCHSRGGDPILGFDLLQLSDDRDALAPHAPAPVAGALTLQSLSDRALVSSLPQAYLTTPPRIHAKTPEGRAAMGYLHGNCGGCHNPKGRAAFTGQFLRHEVGAIDETEEKAFATTVNVESKYKIPGADEESYRILPGAPEQSTVHYRMSVDQGTGMMPPRGRKTVDREAEKLIADWIRALGSR